MAKIIKREKEYYVQFYGNGLLFEKYAGADKATAEKVLKEIETSLPNGAMSNFVPDQGLDGFYDQFKRFFQRKYSESTMNEFEAAYELFLDHLKRDKVGIKKLSGITPKVLGAYQLSLAKRIEKDEANFQIFLLSRMFDFAITKAYLNDNPAFHIMPLDVKAIKGLKISACQKKLKDANSNEELLIKFISGDTSVSERLKLVKWKMIRDLDLKNALVLKLLNAQVPLAKIFDIFDIDNIRDLKIYAGWKKGQKEKVRS